MNPVRWKREHQIALGIAGIIGATLGVLVAYTTRLSPNSMGFFYWLDTRGWPDVIWWALLGALIGGGIVYARQLLRS